MVIKLYLTANRWLKCDVTSVSKKLLRFNSFIVIPYRVTASRPLTDALGEAKAAVSQEVQQTPALALPHKILVMHLHMHFNLSHVYF